MAVVSELIRCESDGTISFGDYSLETKSKLDNVSHQGDLYKVKTFKEITKLERNGMFVYFQATEDGVTFTVEGPEDAQITLELEPETEYDVKVAGADAGTMKTNLGGKLNLSVELDAESAISVDVKKC